MRWLGVAWASLLVMAPLTSQGAPSSQPSALKIEALPAHALTREADGALRFCLRRLAAPTITACEVPITLKGALRAFTPEGEVAEIELDIGAPPRRVSLEAPGTYALPCGALIFRYLLDGEGPSGVVETSACFELRSPR
ncbi:hypothetical protein KKF91_01315 [Myxococcota bacterium]|nr:hypothetical protein [Myxococcota bacterium]MBU1429175.1 hypothetical protein [Myxococcota bacterium]MBU1896373.1 hypothetical protein [Myxococcota bacterium]